jgi:hypothetical protein
MKRWIALVLSCFAFNTFAQTPTAGRDYSDIWWNSSESGWGMNVVHQDTILFVTLFIYGTDRKPTWYVASNVAYVSTNTAGDDVFRGDLYQTNGSAFNAATFDPTSTTVATVGTLTFTGLASGGATVSYTVNGVSSGNIAKSVVRQTWRVNAITATQYQGATSYTRSACNNPSLNGNVTDSAVYTLTITGATLKLVEDNGPGQICNWNGNYTQEGRFGKSTGTVVCEDGVPGTYTFTQLQVSPQSFGANWTGRATCTVNGRIGGPKK